MTIRITVAMSHQPLGAIVSEWRVTVSLSSLATAPSIQSCVELVRFHSPVVPCASLMEGDV